ncbi:MAG: HupE/UreJ family protein [Bacteroidota bacterium]
MDNLYTYIQLGIDHILNTKGYDHILFIIALTVLYSLKEWKTLLILVTAFTIGHSLTLALSVLNIVSINSNRIEFLIVLSIAATAIMNIIRAGKTPSHNGLKAYYVLALFFGFIHGMGFANYLRAILGKSGEIITPLLGFNIGLEIGQLIIVAVLLIITLLLDILFKVRKQNFIVIASSIILGITIPMLLEHEWKTFF